MNMSMFINFMLKDSRRVIDKALKDGKFRDDHELELAIITAKSCIDVILHTDDSDSESELDSLFN